MPIFAYQCRACGHHFEELQKLGAASLTDCPACNAPELEKQLSAPNVHFKGRGWRKTGDAPPPKRKPKYAHTFDSPVPHAEHTSDGHGHRHEHGHGHDHTHDHEH